MYIILRIIILRDMAMPSAITQYTLYKMNCTFFLPSWNDKHKKNPYALHLFFHVYRQPKMASVPSHRYLSFQKFMIVLYLFLLFLSLSFIFQLSPPLPLSSSFCDWLFHIYSFCAHFSFFLRGYRQNLMLHSYSNPHATCSGLKSLRKQCRAKNGQRQSFSNNL